MNTFFGHSASTLNYAVIDMLKERRKQEKMLRWVTTEIVVEGCTLLMKWLESEE